MKNWPALATLLLLAAQIVDTNPDARRLMEQLFVGYNKLVRPVLNNKQVVTVKLKLRLSQLLDVHEKTQIITTNVWLKQQWTDYKLTWNPDDYGGVHMLHVDSNDIWVPDIVLYNNADGHYQVTIKTKALLRFDGTVIWEPPAVYKSMCQMHVLWFPFDEQFCNLKFGSWTYDGSEVDLLHSDMNDSLETNNERVNITIIREGIDMKDYYPSAEWDIMEVPAERRETRFSCCPAPYIDLRFSIHLRRKTLFYTVNLIIPSVALSVLTVFVFYLPSDSGEKVGFSISILISLTVFFLLLVEIIPSTSLVIPLIGLYLLFTMVMVTLSIAVTVITLNVHYRSPNLNSMSNWMRVFFTMWLPWALRIRRPVYDAPEPDSGSPTPRPSVTSESGIPGDRRRSLALVPRRRSMTGLFPSAPSHQSMKEMKESVEATQRERSALRRMSMAAKKRLSKSVIPAWGLVAQVRAKRAMVLRRETAILEEDEEDEEETERLIGPEARAGLVDGACYVADVMKQKAIDDKIRGDWQYIAQVLDSLFLWIFAFVCFCGTAVMLLRAPVIWDTRQPVA